ncbi:MAG: SprB repeat-containing protein [Chitinophagales bacterium]
MDQPNQVINSPTWPQAPILSVYSILKTVLAFQPVTLVNSYAVTGSITSQTNVSCFGGADGGITVALSGGYSSICLFSKRQCFYRHNNL